MTCAGISSLIITGLKRFQGQEYLQGETIQNCGKGGVQPSLQARDRLAGQHFQVGQNFGNGQQWKFYYLYGLERAGRLGGHAILRPARLVSPGGRGARPRAEPAFRLLAGGGRRTGPAAWPPASPCSFLAKGRAPVLINKLRHAPRGDWNNDPDDIRNLVGIVSRDWKNLLTWQVVDPAVATVADLLQAPIVFFNGHKVPEFNAMAKQNLRDYVEQGGFIFADACCGSQEFDAGFKQLMKELFPEEEFKLRPLSDDHPVWRAKHLLYPDVHPLWGIEHGCRTVVIYSPQGPLVLLEPVRDAARPTRRSSRRPRSART